MSSWKYIVSSRAGLFLIDHAAWHLASPGIFFGLTLRGGDVYCFEARDPPSLVSRRGRIVRFRYEGGDLRGGETVADNLDNRCHQMDLFGDNCLLTDTANQCILQFDKDWRHSRTYYPLLRAPTGAWDAGYAHLNSILCCHQSVYVMLHHGGVRRSEILELDLNLRERRRLQLTDYCCHDIVRLENGAFMASASTSGCLITTDGQRVKIDELMTRGLAVTSDEIAVGSSLFGPRFVRHMLPGFVTIMDRSYRLLGRLSIPGAPAQIRSLHAGDRPLS